jgi:hypothetical protein
MKGVSYSPSVIERFWKRANKSDGCWVWTGTKSKGYGVLKLPSGSNVRAHRLSYELNCGPIPEGLVVCHKCDNPPCVNPDHLFVGTNADNIQDMWAKNRGRRAAPKVPKPRKPLKTHCKNGHPFAGENVRIVTYEPGKTYRACRQCVANNKSRWVALRRAS